MDFAANLGVAFVDVWAFLVGRVVTNGKDLY